MGQLTGQKIKNSYKDLLQISNSNQGVDGTLRQIEDGEGEGASIKLSQTKFEAINNSAMNSGIVTFVHNMTDDLGTDNHYLPWSDETESANSGGRYYFANPYTSMRLRRVAIRMKTVNAQTLMTLQVGTIANGVAVTTGNFTVVASGSFTHDNSSNKYYVLNEADFNVTPDITQTPTAGNGKLVAMRLGSDSDPMGSSTEVYISSTWGVTL